MSRTRQDARRSQPAPRGRGFPRLGGRGPARGRGRTLALLLRLLRELAAGNGGLPLDVAMLTELLRVGRRTVFRLLAALREAEVPLTRREVQGSAYYSIRPRELLGWLSEPAVTMSRKTTE